MRHRRPFEEKIQWYIIDDSSLSLSLYFLLNNNIKLFKKLTEIIIDDIYNINIYQRAAESIENNSLVVLDSADISFT